MLGYVIRYVIFFVLLGGTLIPGYFLIAYEGRELVDMIGQFNTLSLFGLIPVCWGLLMIITDVATEEERLYSSRFEHLAEAKFAGKQFGNKVLSQYVVFILTYVLFHYDVSKLGYLMYVLYIAWFVISTFVILLTYDTFKAFLTKQYIDRRGALID